MASSSSLLSNRVNVFGKPLIVHSTSPVTGYFRNGFCDTDTSDIGNHTVAGIVTEEFLDYSAAQGNDLRVAGLKGGCRWCLCVNRWKEAFDAYKSGKVSEDTVPKVNLEATHVRALESGITINQLNEFGLGKQNLRFWLAGSPVTESQLL